MNNERGFTLVETMVATLILVPGLLAVCAMFSYSIASEQASRQTTVGTLIVTDKMEHMRSLPLSSSLLNVGGGLNPASPSTGYHDYVTVSGTGALTSGTTSSPQAYLRLWQVAGTNPKTVTVVVYAVRNALSRRGLELARSSTLVTNTN